LGVSIAGCEDWGEQPAMENARIRGIATRIRK
jgi:hypothetical protein